MKKYWFVPVVLTFLLIAIWSAISASPDHEPVHIDTHNPADFECYYSPIIAKCFGCEHWGAITQGTDATDDNGVPFCQLPPWTPTPEGGATVQAPTPTPEPPDDDDKVTICHKPGTPAEKTMEVPQPAVQGHLNHGDYIGECIDD